MFAEILKRATSVWFWGSICLLYSLFVASGALFMGAAIVGAILLVVVMLIGPQFIAYVLLLGEPTIFGLPNQFLQGLPFITMERVMFVMLVGALLARMITEKEKPVRFSSYEYLILSFLAYALASLLLTSVDQRQDLWFFMQYAMPMLMFVMSRRIGWDEPGVRFLLGSMTLAGIFLAVVGILQVKYGIRIFLTDYQSAVTGHEGRAHGVFSSSHTYGATLMIFFVLTLLQYSLYRDALVRILLVFCMLAIGVGIVLAQSRASWVGFSVSMLIIFLLDRRIRPVMLVVGCVAFIGIFVTLATMDDTSSIVARVTNVRSIASRMATWNTALNMIFGNPVFGVGFGDASFAAHKLEYLTGAGSLSAEFAKYLAIPHNEFLHVGVQLGFLGLFIFLKIMFGAVAMMFRICGDACNSHPRRLFGAYVGAVIVGLLINSMFSDTFMQDYFWMLTFFLAGFVLSMPADFELCARDERAETVFQ